MRGARRHPGAPPAPRSRSSATPTPSTAELLATYRPGGVNRLSFGVQSMVPHVLARARAHPRRRRRSPGPWRDARRAGFDNLNLDLIYGGAGESARGLGRHARPGARARTRPRQRLRPHRRGRARRWPPTRIATPTTTTRPTSTSWPTERLSRRRARVVRDLQLGPARPRAAATTDLYWARATTSASAAPPTRTAQGRRWWNVRTPERYIECVQRRTLDRGGGRDARPSETRHLEGLQLALRTVGGVPVEALPPGVVRARRPGRGARRSGPAHGGGPPAGQRGVGSPQVSATGGSTKR